MGWIAGPVRKGWEEEGSERIEYVNIRSPHNIHTVLTMCQIDHIPLYDSHMAVT